MLQGCLITVEMRLIMQSLWLDPARMRGPLKTHGVLPGVNKDLSGWQRETLAVSALDHLSHYDSFEI